MAPPKGPGPRPQTPSPLPRPAPGPDGEDGPGQREPNRSALQVLDRAFAILSLFSVERPTWTMTEIAAHEHLPMTTTHRILGVLVHHGFLARDEDSRRFRLGTSALDLGLRARSAVSMRAVAEPPLRRLAAETGETAFLTVPDELQGESICIARVESSQPLRLALEPGRRVPLHAGAMQRALLAFMRDEDVERLLSRPLRHLCVNTITDPSRLRLDLAQVRARGYAISFEETDMGLWGIGVPLLDHSGHAVAGVGTVGPIVRHRPEQLELHLDSCRRAAAEIAASLGFVAVGTR